MRNDAQRQAEEWVFKGSIPAEGNLKGNLQAVCRYGPLLWAVLWVGVTSNLRPLWQDNMAGQLNWLQMI